MRMVSATSAGTSTGSFEAVVSVALSAPPPQAAARRPTRRATRPRRRRRGADAVREDEVSCMIFQWLLGGSARAVDGPLAETAGGTPRHSVATAPEVCDVAMAGGRPSSVVGHR